MAAHPAHSEDYRKTQTVRVSGESVERRAIAGRAPAPCDFGYLTRLHVAIAKQQVCILNLVSNRVALIGCVWRWRI
jgi:hypothetical protein